MYKYLLVLLLLGCSTIKPNQVYVNKYDDINDDCSIVEINKVMVSYISYRCVAGMYLKIEYINTFKEDYVQLKGIKYARNRK